MGSGPSEGLGIAVVLMILNGFVGKQLSSGKPGSETGEDVKSDQPGTTGS